MQCWTDTAMWSISQVSLVKVLQNLKDEEAVHREQKGTANELYKRGIPSGCSRRSLEKRRLDHQVSSLGVLASLRGCGTLPDN